MEILASLEETKLLASKLAADARVGDCYCLIGDLGAGKTEFARAFIRKLCGREIKVSSPTFNICQVYDDKIWHFDLYRLEDVEELAEIGLEDALERGIALVEWPQIAMDYLPDNRVEVKFEIIDEGKRKITVIPSQE